MRQLSELKHLSLNLLYRGVQTTHGRIVLCGLLVGLCYLPVWLMAFATRAATGSSSLLMMLAVIYLASQDLWKHRREIARSLVSDEDRLLGHTLIISGCTVFPFCRFALWSQAMIWLLVLVGIAISSGGLSFFKKYPVPLLLIPLSVYPKPAVTIQLIWEAITPHHMLENFMAWAGGFALRVIGQPAVSSEAFITLPTGAVQVAWVCNGFNMAMTMAAASLILGLFLKQSWIKMLVIVLIGFFLALALNVPRVVLMTMAAVYWGKESFDFWHGPLGGQILSGLLFTIYYYVVMAVVRGRPKRSRAG